MVKFTPHHSTSLTNSSQHSQPHSCKVLLSDPPNLSPQISSTKPLTKTTTSNNASIQPRKNHNQSQIPNLLLSPTPPNPLPFCPPGPKSMTSMTTTTILKTKSSIFSSLKTAPNSSASSKYGNYSNSKTPTLPIPIHPIFSWPSTLKKWITGPKCFKILLDPSWTGSLWPMYLLLMKLWWPAKSLKKPFLG